MVELADDALRLRKGEHRRHVDKEVMASSEGANQQLQAGRGPHAAQAT
jgi:hypothetical protein